MSLTKNKIIFTLGCLICTLFILYHSVYTVTEGQIALVSKKQHVISLQGPGLHFKLPFAQITPIDMRLQSFLFNKVNLLTADGQALNVDYYANWRITQPALYYAKTQHETQKTQQRLTQTINTLLEKEYAHNTFNSIMTNAQMSILNTVLTQANTQIKTLGIALVGIGFKSIDFPSEENTTLLKTQRTEQAQLALAQLAIGKANAENIRAKADNQAALLLAKTKEKAAIIRGQGDAQAAKIYSDAYHKNPQFASFYLNLEAYRQGFTQSSTGNNFLVLNTKEDFFNLANGHTKTAKNLG
jgi:modulator of FtsH protease HflC